MTKPIVSIVVATYNRVEHCKKAIESIIAQDYKKWEIIIIDDASILSNSEELKVFLNKKTKFDIHYLRNTKNLGMQASLVKSIQQAKGKYIARLDDDDIWISKKKLSTQIAIFEKNPQLVLLGTHYQDEHKKPHYYPTTDSSIRKQLPFRCPFCHSSVVYTLQAYKAVGGYNTALKYGADWDLWLRLSRIGKLMNLNENMVLYRQEGNTMTSASFINQHQKNWDIVYPHLKYQKNKYLVRVYHQFVIFYFNNCYAPKTHKFFQVLFKKIFSSENSGYSGQ